MHRILYFVIAAACAAPAAARPAWLLEPTLQSRLVFDRNPLGLDGVVAESFDAEEVWALTVTGGFGVAWPAGARLGYGAELTRFDGLASENHSLHRLTGSWQGTAGEWRLAADGAFTLIDGDGDPLAVTPCNANGLPLWRDRRDQNQQRAKLTARRDFGTAMVRFTGALLGNDYHTRTLAGRIPLVDRHDAGGGVDLGWIASPRALWFAGVRAGEQRQNQVPLPGGAIDYSNGYTRVLAGWEGRLGADTTLAVAAGPDFRRYDGAIDVAAFGDRDRTSFWFEGAFATKLRPDLALTAKASRWNWLSSTGKSAYNDFAVETALAWTVRPPLALRAAAKLHRCDYFPAVRDDWERVLTLGATYQATRTLAFSAEVLRHRGWSDLRQFTDRGFRRTVLTAGATLKF